MGRNGQLQRWIESGTNFNFKDGSDYDSPDFAALTPTPAVPAAGETPLMILKSCR